MPTKKLSFAAGSEIPTVPNDGTIYIRETECELPQFGRLSTSHRSLVPFQIAEAYVGTNDNILPIGAKTPMIELRRVLPIHSDMRINTDLRLDLTGLITGHSYEIRGCYRHNRNRKGTHYIEMPNGWNLPDALGNDTSWKARVDHSTWIKYANVDIHATPFFQRLDKVSDSCQTVQFSSWYNVQRMIKNQTPYESTCNCFIGQYLRTAYTPPSLKIIFRLYDVTYTAPIFLAETHPIVYTVSSSHTGHIFYCEAGLNYSTFPYPDDFTLKVLTRF